MCKVKVHKRIGSDASMKHSSIQIPHTTNHQSKHYTHFPFFPPKSHHQHYHDYMVSFQNISPSLVIAMHIRFHHHHSLLHFQFCLHFLPCTLHFPSHLRLPSNIQKSSKFGWLVIELINTVTGCVCTRYYYAFPPFWAPFRPPFS